MSEASQTNVDPSGINRTPDGTIAPPIQLNPTEEAALAAQREKTSSTPTSTQKDQTTQTSTKKDDGSDKDQTQDNKDKSLLDKDAKEEKPAGAPEKYADFKAPEGYTLDSEVVGKAQAMFKEMNLSQEQGQKLVDLYAENFIKAAEAPYKHWQEKNNEWQQETIKSDMGNGKDGLKPEVKAGVSKAIDAMGPAMAKEFRDFMNYSGAGNHLAFVRAVNFWAKAYSEPASTSHANGSGPSKFGQAKPGSPTGPSAASLYPNLPSASGG